MNLRVRIKWKTRRTVEATQRGKWKVVTFEIDHQKVEESWSRSRMRNQKADESKRNSVNTRIVKREDQVAEG